MNPKLSFPIGSSKAQIEALLKSEGLEHSYVGDRSSIDITSAVADNGFRSSDLSGYFIAIVRHTSVGILVSGDMQYFFFFDNEDKLLKATVKEILTGL